MLTVPYMGLGSTPEESLRYSTKVIVCVSPGSHFTPSTLFVPSGTSAVIYKSSND